MIASLDVSITREEVTIAGEVRFVVVVNVDVSIEIVIVVVVIVVVLVIRASSKAVIQSFKLRFFALKQ